jgi:hypothetical protein
MVQPVADDYCQQIMHWQSPRRFCSPSPLSCALLKNQNLQLSAIRHVFRFVPRLLHKHDTRLMMQNAGEMLDLRQGFGYCFALVMTRTRSCCHRTAKHSSHPAAQREPTQERVVTVRLCSGAATVRRTSGVRRLVNQLFLRQSRRERELPR